MKTTLTNEQLIDKSFEWVKKLADTSGRAWALRVPVDFNNDPDMLFVELGNRLKAADEENKRLRESLEKIMNMKAVQDNVGLSQYFIKSRAIASNALLTPTPQP